MKISTELKEQIIALYQSGLSIRIVSDKLGVSKPTISKILKSNNIIIRKSNYQKLNLPTAKINELYQSGLSTYEIASKYNCSDETIRKIIVNIRPQKERNKRSDESISKIAKASKKNWQDPEYKKKVADGKTDEYYEILRNHSKRNFDKSLGKWVKSDEGRKRLSDIAKSLWQNPEYRAKQEVWYQERVSKLVDSLKIWTKDPIKRKAWIDKLRKTNANRASTGWVSTSQAQLYFILSDSNIDYFEEGTDTKIGPFYVVDCVIPQQQSMTKPLIVEVNGEYWHSLPHVMLKDRQKATYIRRYTSFDLLTLSELEMSNFNAVKSKLSNYGLKLNDHQFSVSDLSVKQITEHDAKTFYSIFHYSSTIRKGALTFGAHLNDKLIAVISYTYPLRRETAFNLGYDMKEVMEISRLARQTNITCKNLLSWFIGKTKKLLPDGIKCLVSFSDSTLGHTGTTYKACNFKQSGTTKPDYYYASLTSKYHKKTIWDRAKKMKLSESDYAEKHNLLKIPTEEKTRWILKLKA